LTVPEIKALLAARDEEAYPVKQLVTMLLLTRERRAEVAQMKWAEVDFEAKVWTLPRERSKNGRELVLPLSEALIDMLHGLPRFENNPYVFSFGGRGPVANFKWKNRLDAAMAARFGEGFTPWRLHDLRRTAASGMAGIGIAPHVVEAVLNHKSGVIKGVASVYNKYSYQPEMRAALEAWSQHVREITGDVEANVVKMRA
jgi:integrase